MKVTAMIIGVKVAIGTMMTFIRLKQDSKTHPNNHSNKSYNQTIITTISIISEPKTVGMTWNNYSNIKNSTTSGHHCSSHPPTSSPNREAQ